MSFRSPPPTVVSRLVGRLVLSAVALAALFVVAYFGTLGVAHAQEDGVSPDAVAAATADLATRTGVSAESITLLRGEAVTWRDGCLGVYVEGEFCTQALVDGFVLWLGDGAYAYRYHTNADGSVLSFAEGNIPLTAVDSAPLPDGVLPPETGGEEPSAQPLPLTATELLAAITAQTGFETQVLQTFAPVTQPFIAVPGTAFQVGATTGEVYELASPEEVNTITVALQFDGAIAPTANATLWAVGALIVILNDAPSHIAEQDAISAVIGDPLLLTIAGPLLPGLGGDATPPPGALPATGSGGLLDAGDRGGDGPSWIWGIVASVLVILAGTNYGVQRRFTPR